ncbi:MAG: hypothetical protein M9952_01040 [Microthrixaceae bacterium]|nr:hypothetical protein [Microthrixaceae bacterium]HPB44356.1 hypothetical protein [Microthrixaceae bacterium]
MTTSQRTTTAARPKRSERGSATLTMLAGLLMIGVAGAAVVMLAFDGLERGRAQAVADLVALAAASEPGVGSSLAQRNGAILDSIELRGDVTVVVVRLGDSRAIAAARLERAG